MIYVLPMLPGATCRLQDALSHWGWTWTLLLAPERRKKRKRGAPGTGGTEWHGGMVMIRDSNMEFRFGFRSY